MTFGRSSVFAVGVWGLGYVQIDGRERASILRSPQAISFMISLYHFYLACFLLSVCDHMIPYDALCKTESCICHAKICQNIAQADTIQVQSYRN